MQNIITKVEDLKDKFRSHYAMEENAYGKACDDIISLLQNLQQTDCSTQLPPSGIKEFDELIKQFQNSDISFLQLTSMLWNKGYEAGKEYCSGGN